MTPLEVTIVYAALTLGLLALAYVEHRREKCPTPPREDTGEGPRVVREDTRRKTPS